MKRDFIAGFGVVLFSILLLVLAVSHEKKKESKIDQWASQNGYEIVKIEETFFDNGPFDKQNGESVYRVRVRDKHNNEYTSWFKIVGINLNQEWEHKRIFEP